MTHTNDPAHVCAYVVRVIHALMRIFNDSLSIHHPAWKTNTQREHIFKCNRSYSRGF